MRGFSERRLSEVSGGSRRLTGSEGVLPRLYSKRMEGKVLKVVESLEGKESCHVKQNLSSFASEFF